MHDDRAGSEVARLAKLADYQILDTPPERDFDDIAAAAARLFGVPISAVSLIDRDRQWFKARYGLAAAETPRAQAFCAHTIQTDEVLVVPDAAEDPRFAANPLVTGNPNIRFYAGAPLITPDHIRIGALCVIDDKPRAALTDEQRTMLTMLARLVVRELENRRMARRAEHQAAMSARLIDAVLALALARMPEELARALAEHARRLCVADVVRVGLRRAGGIEPVVSQREGADAGVPSWDLLDAALATAPAGEVAPASAVLAPPGAWIGMRLSGTATFQIWRRLTGSFTEMELAMIKDLTRAAAALLQRLP
jgi:GAF domain-containing protein